LGFRAWFYQGRLDTTPPSLLTGFSTELHNAGAEVHYGFFKGGHDWALWRRQLPHMLVVASRWFAQPPAGHASLSHVGRSLPESVLTAIHLKRVRRCLSRRPGPGVHIGGGCRHYRLLHPDAVRAAAAARHPSG
jgi:hypothetical protein